MKINTLKNLYEGFLCAAFGAVAVGGVVAVGFAAGAVAAANAVPIVIGAVVVMFATEGVGLYANCKLNDALSAQDAEIYKKAELAFGKEAAFQNFLPPIV